MNIDQIKQDLRKYRDLCNEALEEAKKKFEGILLFSNIDYIKLKELYLKIDEHGNETIIIKVDYPIANKLYDFLYKSIEEKTGNKNIEIITEC